MKKRLKEWILGLLDACPKRELELAMEAEAFAKRQVERYKDGRDEFRSKYKHACEERDRFYKDRGDLIALNRQLKIRVNQLLEDLSSAQRELITTEKFYRQNTDMRLDTLRKKNKQTKKS